MSTAEPSDRTNGFRNLANKIGAFLNDRTSSHELNNLSNCPKSSSPRTVTSFPTSLDQTVPENRLDANERLIISRLFDELKNRSSTEGGIDKIHFTDYFKLPILWSERLFEIFNSQGRDYIDEKDFIHNMAICCRGTKNERKAILFRLFDADNDSIVGRAEFSRMLINAPQIHHIFLNNYQCDNNYNMYNKSVSYSSHSGSVALGYSNQKNLSLLPPLPSGSCNSKMLSKHTSSNYAVNGSEVHSACSSVHGGSMRADNNYLLDGNCTVNSLSTRNKPYKLFNNQSCEGLNFNLDYSDISENDKQASSLTVADKLNRSQCLSNQIKLPLSKEPSNKSYSIKKQVPIEPNLAIDHIINSISNSAIELPKLSVCSCKCDDKDGKDSCVNSTITDEKHKDTSNGFAIPSSHKINCISKGSLEKIATSTKTEERKNKLDKCDNADTDKVMILNLKIDSLQKKFNNSKLVGDNNNGVDSSNLATPAFENLNDRTNKNGLTFNNSQQVLSNDFCNLRAPHDTQLGSDKLIGNKLKFTDQSSFSNKTAVSSDSNKNGLDKSSLDSYNDTSLDRAADCNSVIVQNKTVILQSFSRELTHNKSLTKLDKTTHTDEIDSVLSFSLSNDNSGKSSSNSLGSNSFNKDLEITGLIEQMRRSEEESTQIIDFDEIINMILDEFDASAKDGLEFVEFNCFIDKYSEMLNFFINVVTQDLYSCPLNAEKKDKTLIKWNKLQQFFQLNPTYEIVNNTYSATKHLGAQFLQSAVCSDENISRSNLNEAASPQVYLNNVMSNPSTSTMNFTTANFPDSSDSVIPYTLIVCPNCRSPFLVCPKCGKEFPRLLVEDDGGIYVSCESCLDGKIRNFDKCWFCNIKFSDIITDNDEVESVLNSDACLLEDDKLVPVRAFCNGRLLHYYKHDNLNVPSGFIYLDYCYVEKVFLVTKANKLTVLNAKNIHKYESKSVLYGIELVTTDLVSKKYSRVLVFDSESIADMWVTNLQKILMQQPINELYEIGELVGHGRFSVVYYAIELATKEVVAIKLINKKRMGDADRSLLKQELNLLRILNHPNIVKLKNVANERDKLYIIMEYISGDDLFKAVTDNNCFSEQVVHRLTTQILRTLLYLHNCGIVHRDIKPENLLLSSKDIDNANIVLVDFGLSCLCGPNDKLTHPCGTLAYAAPEILSQEGYGCKIDIWGTGVIVYFMLCGKVPFPINKITPSTDNNNSNNTNCKDRQQCYKLKFNEPVWEKVSESCKDFINRLLEVDQEKRLSSAEALNHVWISNQRAVL